MIALMLQMNCLVLKSWGLVTECCFYQTKPEHWWAIWRFISGRSYLPGGPFGGLFLVGLCWAIASGPLVGHFWWAFGGPFLVGLWWAISGGPLLSNCWWAIWDWLIADLWLVGAAPVSGLTEYPSDAGVIGWTGARTGTKPTKPERRERRLGYSSLLGL